MEKHPIEIWDQFVCDTLYPAKLINSSVDNGSVALLRGESAKARDLIRSWIIHETFLCKSEQEIRLIVQQHQVFLTNLLDLIFEYLSVFETQAEFQNLYEQVAGDLESNLKFLETSFSGYFNQNLKAPNFSRDRFEKIIKTLFKTTLTNEDFNTALFYSGSLFLQTK